MGQQNKQAKKVYNLCFYVLRLSDEVAEWLRRWTANPMCSARVGSNPILVVICFFLHNMLNSAPIFDWFLPMQGSCLDDVIIGNFVCLFII